MWYRKSANQGDALAQLRLGILYFNGKGVKKDFKQAVMWCRKSAEQGDANAQYFLGLMYLEGIGVTQNYVLAHMWLNIAAANGLDAAGKKRDTIAKEMMSSQIEKAQDLASKWVGQTSNETPNVHPDKNN